MYRVTRIVAKERLRAVYTLTRMPKGVKPDQSRQEYKGSLVPRK
jgi:hypothetical protein